MHSLLNGKRVSLTGLDRCHWLYTVSSSAQASPARNDGW